MNVHALCAEGANAYFFRCLARADREKNVCSVAMPHTILFESGSVIEWFYSPSHVDCVKLKNIDHNCNAEVKQQFCGNNSANSIVAWTLSGPLSGDRMPAAHHASGLVAPLPSRVLSKHDLSDFLDARQPEPCLVQQVVLADSAIDATWSPMTCKVDSRCIMDELPKCEQATLGHHRHKTSSNVAAQTYHRVRLACERIARHLEALDRTVRITDLHLCFKLDSQQRLFLLFSTLIRVDCTGTKKPPNMNANLFPSVSDNRKKKQHLPLSPPKGAPHALQKHGIPTKSTGSTFEKDLGRDPNASFGTLHDRQAPKALNHVQQFYLDVVDRISLLLQSDCAPSVLQLVRATEESVVFLAAIPPEVSAAVPDFVVEEVFEAFGGKCIPDGLECSADPFAWDIAIELTRMRIQRALNNVVFDVKLYS